MASNPLDSIKDKVTRLKTELAKKDKAIESLRAGKGIKDQRVILELDESRLVEQIGSVVSDFRGVVTDSFGVFDSILDAVRENKVEFPSIDFPQEIKISNFPRYPDFPTFKGIEVKLDSIKQSIDNKKFDITLPTEAKDAIPVRLSDGTKFYEAVTQFFGGGGGGGTFVPTVSTTSNTQLKGVVVINPDGSNILGGARPLSTGGTASSSGNNTLIAAGTNKTKVCAFSLSTTSTTAVTCIFQSGASGTELWRVILQAPTSISTGANLAVPAPAYLFSTATATLLNLNLSAAVTVHWAVSYFDEA